MEPESLPNLSIPYESNTSLKNNVNKSESEIIGDPYQLKPKAEDNRKIESIEFINGPAKLKKKWVDFIGGQSVVDSMGLSKNDVKRQEIIYEMIDTERDYVNDLSIIIELYIQPLERDNIISKKDFNTLFSSIEQIYGVNKELLSLFENRQQENPFVSEIGDIWLTMNEYLKIYLLYCSNYAYALIKLENLKTSRSFSRFIYSQFQNPKSRGLTLDSFLIKPVQRICKYPLLLKELLKYTDESNKDYENLKNGYEKLQTVVNVVNGASKVVEAVYSLIELQSRFNPKISIVTASRKIKYKSEVTISIKKMSSPTSQTVSPIDQEIEKKQRIVFIFNDMLIIAKALSQEPNRLEKGKLKLIEKREFSDVEVDSGTETKDKDPNLINTIEITLNNPEAHGIIFCNSETEKEELLYQLTSSLKEYETNNAYTNNPKVVKRLPSEKVYSMISNMSKVATDIENDLNSKQDEEKLQEQEEEQTKDKEKEDDVPLSFDDKIKIGAIIIGLAVFSLFTLILFFKLCSHLEQYFYYYAPVVIISLFAIKNRNKFIKKD
ncbi:Dbl homology domain-containing protein [Neocallimastix californiae]|uniref:Dbl homology domain-containing protein n=1 Tax=Neocallimastix californiae TaxID=1754190 RepID=A0A1Y2DAB8_9FUNG|nr:Dbl homology domain-containing protein [Neocallimastix californiae]|eukprot:ORY56212.1 Dbl homology domain-containing protein [Neocallimastix californiae]